jgi:hypothetical protein
MVDLMTFGTEERPFERQALMVSAASGPGLAGSGP